MRPHGMRDRVLAILFSGIAIGSIGLLEPLIGFWRDFHLLGMHWPTLLLVYLGCGLLIALVAGVIVSIGLATRAARWRPVTVASYYVAGAAAVATVLIAAPLIHREAAVLQTHISYAVLFPVLVVLAVILTIKLTPHLMVPILGTLIGHRSGHIARPRLIVLLLLIGLLIPITIIKESRSRYRDDGRVPRPELQSRPGAQQIQNLLLVTVCGLRADHLGCYGYDRSTSATIDALAEESVVFANCFSQGNCTELSFGSLFTSLHPSIHSVKRWGYLANRLPDEVETVAECLQDAGLHTVGLMSNPFIKREWGLTQGFSEILEFHYGHLELFPVRYLVKLGLLPRPDRTPAGDLPRASLMVNEAIRQLHELKDAPFFLHVHFMDTHHPYIPPPAYQDVFASPDAVHTDAEKLWQRGWTVFGQLPSQKDILSPGEVKRIAELYDGAIRYVDEQLARLLGELDSLGLAENTLLVLTSDHGTEFLEHGDIFHKSPFLYDELIHVPLIIRFPGLPSGERVTHIVRHIDLMPTLLKVFDLPPSPGMQGQSLMSLLGGAGLWRRVPAFSESYAFMSVRTQSHKLMYDRRADGTAYGYDLARDPKEMINVSGESSACDSLDAVLTGFLRKVSLPIRRQPSRELDHRTREQLRSIGYM